MLDYKLTTPVLYVENLSVQYDGKDIIKDINLIEKDVVRDGHTTGQVVAFVGRSGRGKSTLFKALTGLVPPTTGRILIPLLNDPTNAKEVCAGDVGFVNQKYTLFRNKTVLESLMFALRKSSLTKKEKNEKIETHIAEWGLTGVLDKYPNQLSGGQRQRVAILEQILSSENFIIMDEPTSGLDPYAIETVKGNIARISESNEYNTVLFSTHNIEFAVDVADSIHVIGYPSDDPTATYGTIVRSYDLKELGLAWSDDFTVAHSDLVKQIKDVMNNH